MPCIHVRTRCYGKIKHSMEDIHSKLEVFCPGCKKNVSPEEFASTVPMSSLVWFRKFVPSESNWEITDWMIQWSQQEARNVSRPR